MLFHSVNYTSINWANIKKSNLVSIMYVDICRTLLRPSLLSNIVSEITLDFYGNLHRRTCSLYQAIEFPLEHIFQFTFVRPVSLFVSKSEKFALVCIILWSAIYKLNDSRHPCTWLSIPVAFNAVLKITWNIKTVLLSTQYWINNIRNTRFHSSI